MQIPGNRRQRRGDNSLVQAGQQHAQQQPDKNERQALRLDRRAA